MHKKDLNDSNDPVVVYWTGNFAEAALLRSELEAAGFVCEMLNVQHATMTPAGGGMAIGIRLIVPASQAEEALEYVKNRGEGWVTGDGEESNDS